MPVLPVLSCLLAAALFGASTPVSKALLAGLVAFKVVQEIAVHGVQVLDRYNLKDVLDRGMR